MKKTIGLLTLLVVAADATAEPGVALKAFAAHCFSPFLTADRVQTDIAATGVRVDFYDLTPFSNVPPTPGTDVTPGTDRRCDVSFDGAYGADAADIALRGLTAEGIRTEASLPDTHADATLPGTTLLAARFLNPARIAVVHTGTRPGPNGPETFLSVERLTPAASEANR